MYVCLSAVYPEYHKDLELLEIEEGASLSELKTAYRELTKVWHPDRFEHDPKLAEKANRKLALINAAYSRLNHYLNNKNHNPPPQNEKESETEFQSNSKHQTSSPPKKESNKNYVIFILVVLAVLGIIIFSNYTKSKKLQQTWEENFEN